MNRSQLKNLVREVISTTTRKKQFVRDSEEFETEVVLEGGEAVPVKIVYEAAYEDNRFDYSYGSIRGMHDPGSGLVIDDLKIIATEDVPPLVKKGLDIPLKLLSKESAAKLKQELSDDLKRLEKARKEP